MNFDTKNCLGQLFVDSYFVNSGATVIPTKIVFNDSEKHQEEQIMEGQGKTAIAMVGFVRSSSINHQLVALIAVMTTQ